MAITIRNIENFIRTGNFNDAALVELRKMVSFVFNNNPTFYQSLSQYLGDSFLDYVANETYLKLLKGRKNIPLENAFRYICEMIRNVCFDILREKGSYENRIVSIPSSGENDEEIDEEEFLTELAQQNTGNSGENSKDLLISIIAEDDLRILINYGFKIENLCYFIANVFNHPTNYLADKGRDARYKIVERTKKALREFAEKYSVEEEILGELLKLYYERICLKSEDEQDVQRGSENHE
ncbi:MAG: hypothetical protein WBJ29_01180 [Fervidobacterium sp.]